MCAVAIAAGIIAFLVVKLIRLNGEKASLQARLDAEGGAVGVVALGVAGGSAAEATGAHGGDAEREGIEGRLQGGRGDEPGGGAEQAKAGGEGEETHG